MPINQHTGLHVSSGTSGGILTPDIKILIRSAFGVEFIWPPGLAKDSGTGDSSCFTIESISTDRLAVTAVSNRLQQLPVSLDRFLCALLSGDGCHVHICERFGAMVSESLVRLYTPINKSLFDVGYEMLLSSVFCCEEISDHIHCSNVFRC